MRSTVEVALLAVAAVLLIGCIAWIVLRYRNDPAKRERKRRALIGRIGRMGDAMITDVQDTSIFYSYALSGVVYTASQDISKLRHHLPEDTQTLIGPVTIKYLPRNPANSIILSEEWYGFRKQNPPLSKGA